MTGLSFKLFVVLVSLRASVSATENITTFAYTGGVQQFTVPVDVYCITIDAYGAQGGVPLTYKTALGGKGSYIRTEIGVSPGSVLDIYVGGQGLPTSGGWNGGGRGGSSSGRVSYGGGATDVRPLGGDLTGRLIVAGGGGGGARSCSIGTGGEGGCTAGGMGSGDCYSYGNSVRSGGGNQTYGGIRGEYSNSYFGQGGSLGVGGDSASQYGGGGGGGYYGGGGGGAGPGGGGSSYTTGVQLACLSGNHTGDGLMVI
ncbi:unnamed protein product, partial [Ectocarpus fasciculatus]